MNCFCWSSSLSIFVIVHVFSQIMILSSLPLSFSSFSHFPSWTHLSTQTTPPNANTRPAPPIVNLSLPIPRYLNCSWFQHKPPISSFRHKKWAVFPQTRPTLPNPTELTELTQTTSLGRLVLAQLWLTTLTRLWSRTRTWLLACFGAKVRCCICKSWPRLRLSHCAALVRFWETSNCRLSVWDGWGEIDLWRMAGRCLLFESTRLGTL